MTRFVAAHLMLAYGTITPGPPGDPAADVAHRDMHYRIQTKYPWSLSGDSGTAGCVVSLDGLRVVLSPTQDVGSYSTTSRRSYGVDGPGAIRKTVHTIHTISAASAEIDPAQSPAIRDQWRRRLVGPRWSVPYWPLVAALSILPVASGAVLIGRRIRLQRIQHRGLCASCNYDLTGNVSGTCPECGRSVTA